MKLDSFQRGVALYLAIMIMTLLLAIALGMGAIFFGQIRIVRGMGYSVVAFYAADTGIERALYEGGGPGSYSGSLNDASYNVTVINAGDPGCPSPPASDYCIRSVGIYKQIRRAILVTR